MAFSFALRYPIYYSAICSRACRPAFAFRRCAVLTSGTCARGTSAASASGLITGCWDADSSEAAATPSVVGNGRAAALLSEASGNTWLLDFGAEAFGAAAAKTQEEGTLGHDHHPTQIGCAQS
jgi:hypothetical protein